MGSIQIHLMTNLFEGHAQQTENPDRLESE
jgi:hypothetical protein